MKRFPSLIAAGAVALVTACSSESAHLSVRLTDASGDLVSAVVTITRVTLQGDHGELVLSDQETTVDLLSLANETLSLVDDVAVPPGRYEQLRIQISGGYVEVEDGGTTLVYATSPTYAGLPEGKQVAGLLKMPSYAKSGLKVTLPADALVLAAESRILLLDFDVAQSFGHDAGGSDSWVMHPVIKGADITVSGNVVATLALAPGVTLPTVGGAPVTLGQFRAVLKNEAGSEETLPFVSIPGGFAAVFRFLLPGSYTVDVVGPAGVSFATSPAHPAAVTVGEGVDAHADFTITSATSP
jgi:uncharacterized protein DUF4382